MEISGPALPRWTPPQPSEYDYRWSNGHATEDVTRPVFIPIYLHGTETIGELFSYTVRVRSDIEVPSWPDVITLNLDGIVGTEASKHDGTPVRLRHARWDMGDTPGRVKTPHFSPTNRQPLCGEVSRFPHWLSTTSGDELVEIVGTSGIRH